ncbi:hypothetical protein ABW20_dc0105420 [Dactylellina cionopaga]|nr:hypothetical protein ABW20_dc0105420 [Dactylellina cionopaga]
METLPKFLGANTLNDRISSVVSDIARLLTSIPNLQTLHFFIEPTDFLIELKSVFMPPPNDNTTSPAALSPKINLATVKDLYITVDTEWLISLCGGESGLEVLEYGNLGDNTGFANKVHFVTTGPGSFGNSSRPFGGLQDRRAVEFLQGLQRTNGKGLRKITFAAYVHHTGMDPSPSCAKSLRQLPSLRKIRFGPDEDPINVKYPRCNMSHRDLLTVASWAPQVEEIWFRNRFVAFAKQLDGGVEADPALLFWRDTWAADGFGNAM